MSACDALSVCKTSEIQRASVGSIGNDIASYRDATQGVDVSLTISGAQTGNAGGYEVGDVLNSIESLEGSEFVDTLTGDDNSNDLKGLGGDDTLIGGDGYDRIEGGAGGDTIIGGLGADLLTGDAGADMFVFNLGDGQDQITDFENGLDKIDLSGTGKTFGNLTISQQRDAVRGDVSIGDLIVLDDTDILDVDARHFGFT